MMLYYTCIIVWEKYLCVLAKFLGYRKNSGTPYRLTSSKYLKSNISKYTLVNKTLDHIIMGEEVLQKYFYM